VVSNAHAVSRLISIDHPDLDEIKNALTDIISDAKRAGEIVLRSHGLLKRRELEFKLTQMNEVVRNVVSLVHSEALIRHVQIALALDDKLTAIMGDSVQLQQVVLNLIMNAIDATADVPDEPRRITISSRATASHVQILVRDTGKGLSDEAKQRLFEPFFTSKQNGLGMGLTISQDIIHHHGGSLSAEANFPRGTCLTCELPRKEGLS